MRKIIFATLLLASSYAFANTTEDKYSGYLENRCEIHGVPYEIALAVAIVESNFTMIESVANRNGTTDIGIFQLNSGFIDWFEEALWYKSKDFSAYDPENNIEMGVIYLKHLYDHTGDWDMAVRAYNTGLHGLASDPDRSKNYLVKIINTLSELGM